MKLSISFLLVFVFFSLNSQEVISKIEKSKTLNKKPEYFNLEWEEGASYSKELTNISVEIDSIDSFNLEVFVDQNREPVLYGGSISTPVCADGECKLMHIDMFWTLLGDYAGFNTYKALPLTKYDHDEFFAADYLKLHRLLSDERSILKKRKINQLVEKPDKSEVNDVDALSGATVAEVKESVVEGALYSCYVAWHLANGKMKHRISSITKKNITEQGILKMLYSKNSNYQMYALKRIDISQYEKYNERLSEIFKTSVPIVRGFIVKNMPVTFWENEKLQQPFWNAFSKVDLNSRTLLLNHIEHAPYKVVEDISFNLELLSKNQIKQFLSFLEDEKLSKEVLKNLKLFAISKNQSYSYLVQYFLDDL